ncbi:protein tyrosine phosphatase [Pokkaliibacter plantistimulans]|uniref:Protein tyrosine phosphatase n=1 Tax=Proteobacteria bacterium 228 TaxID=2083153 RepID=A0A2S5KIB7_9PROT|nr:protein-tyrosine phosphatase family protein [Pokkaliibacter plantistimulans]PPC74528.1 protein tyrosine phosphatase [Pokkaliibacter plantistimulans]
MNSIPYFVAALGLGRLYVMAKPVAGEWVDEEFASIARSGISLMVSLLEWHEASEVGLEQEALLAQRHGMEFRSYPVADRGLPADKVQFVGFIHDLLGQISAGAQVVVHCRAGIGRTGIVAASLLIAAGYSAGDAFALVSAKRGVEVPDTEEQQAWVTELAAALFQCR